MQKITANLWCKGNAREMAEYYTAVFPDGKIIGGSKYPDGSNGKLEYFQKDFAGKDLTIDIELATQRFTLINSGPEFTFNEAVSFAVSCKDQTEIDYFWEKLSAVPESEQCGWCKDKFGLSWQIAPENFDKILKTKPGAWNIMMNQKKIILADYE